MADEITGVKGFFTETGGLRTKEQIATDETATDRTSATPPKPPSVTTEATNARFTEQTIRNALSPAKTKFVEQANDAASSLNEREQSVDAAEGVVDQELAAATDLKKAIENNDPEGVSTAQSRLSTVREERRSLATKIEKQVTDETKDRGDTRSIKLGREEKARVDLPTVQLTPPPKGDDPKTAKAVDQVIRQLNVDKAQLTTTREQVRSSKEKLRTALESTTKELERIEGDSVRSLDQADALAKKTAASIRGGGKGEALNAFSSLNEEVARNLLAP